MLINHLSSHREIMKEIFIGSYLAPSCLEFRPNDACEIGWHKKKLSTLICGKVS